MRIGWGAQARLGGGQNSAEYGVGLTPPRQPRSVIFDGGSRTAGQKKKGAKISIPIKTAQSPFDLEIEMALTAMAVSTSPAGDIVVGKDGTSSLFPALEDDEGSLDLEVWTPT